MLLASALLVATLFGPPSVAVGKIPPEACQLLTAADYKAFGVSAAPKNRAGSSPSQEMRSCTAGSMMKPPVLMVMIQDIKVPIAVEMGRKSLASEKGEVVTGPWDTGKVMVGTDGTQVHFFKGNVSVLLMSSATTAAARSTLIAIAKRIAAAV